MATVVRLAVVPWTEAENLARSVRDGRPGKGLELPKGTSHCPKKSCRTRRVSRRGARADSGNVRESVAGRSKLDSLERAKLDSCGRGIGR